MRPVPKASASPLSSLSGEPYRKVCKTSDVNSDLYLKNMGLSLQKLG